MFPFSPPFPIPLPVLPASLLAHLSLRHIMAEARQGLAYSQLIITRPLPLPLPLLLLPSSPPGCSPTCYCRASWTKQ
ncbi:unnamed protein product [Closterium sp. NIES-54]